MIEACTPPSGLLPGLHDYLRLRSEESAQIPADRRQRLALLASKISTHLRATAREHLCFICTHNSRRSHLAAVLALASARFHHIPGIQASSAGTEASSFNPRAVRALERIGTLCQRAAGPSDDNPCYHIRYADDAPPYHGYSKRYDDPSIPRGECLVVMVCDEAAEHCPFIPGCRERFSLPFQDPRQADQTQQEIAIYDRAVHDIAREILHAFSLIRSGH